MTPKDKATELINKFHKIIYTDYDHDMQVKKCALIAVDLILSEFYADDFYLEVKKEIEQL